MQKKNQILVKECKEIENIKKADEKNHKIEVSRFNKKLGESTDEYKILQVKNKEKDNEIKLTEMKIKELKK